MDQTPLWQMFFFFNFLGTQVQIQAKKVNSSTPFNTHATPLRGPLWPSWTKLRGWGAAESGGTWSKFDLKLLLLSKKFKKVDFFKNLSFKIKLLLGGHSTHEWVWKAYLRMLLTFFDNWKTLDEHGVLVLLYPAETALIASATLEGERHKKGL